MSITVKNPINYNELSENVKKCITLSLYNTLLCQDFTEYDLIDENNTLTKKIIKDTCSKLEYFGFEYAI